LEFRLNGRALYRTAYGGTSPSEILPMLITSTPNLEYWSEDALREFLQGSLEFIIEFCQHTIEEINHDLKIRPKSWHKRESAKHLKRQTRNFMRKLTSHLRIIPHLKREQLIKHAFDLLLSCDRLGPLKGFGLSNKFGDRLFGDPEKSTVKR